MAQVRIVWNGLNAKNRGKAGAVEGVTKAAEYLLQKSRERVPIEEGTLERSGTVSVDPATESAAVSYDTPYAVIQHEDLTFNHDEGRTAKYLESVFNEQKGQMGRIVAAEVRKALGT